MNVKVFLRLNMISAVFAFALFISFELQVNIYRISRIMGWEVLKTNYVIIVIHFVGFILSIFLFYIMISKWLDGKRARYWTIILWFPYLIIYIIIFSLLFPMTDPGDDPSPVSGLIIIAQLISYPIYLLFINYMAVNERIVEKDEVK